MAEQKTYVCNKCEMNCKLFSVPEGETPEHSLMTMNKYQSYSPPYPCEATKAPPFKCEKPPPKWELVGENTIEERPPLKFTVSCAGQWVFLNPMEIKVLKKYYQDQRDWQNSEEATKKEK